jgi:hypothetical protein
MYQFLRRVFDTVLPRGGSTPATSTLIKHKTDLIELAFGEIKVESFADLGGVWNVDGGYTFYALERFPIKRAVMVDTSFTAAVLERKKLFPQLELISANFGSAETARAVGTVDAILMFDVLLHQVTPNWDEVLALHAPATRAFLIYNPQLMSSARTLRLVDLDEEAYFRNVPHTKEEEPYRTVFASPDAIHPERGRPNRDIHDIWQWGITDEDLSMCMRRLGFVLKHFATYGRWKHPNSFENHGFVFVRQGAG